MTTLAAGFFARPAEEVAADLVGCVLVNDGVGGVIVETEAYTEDDEAAHSYKGPTPRTAVMFGPAGYLYVYRSYGIHWCMNIVCGHAGRGDAVLLRAVRPTHGIPTMRARRGIDDERLLCAGPGRLCQALGITGEFNGRALAPGGVNILARTEHVEVICDRRIGISKNVACPWRFLEAGSPWVSRRPSKGAR